MAAVALLVSGCGGQRLVSAAGQPGTTTILVENQVESPDELDRLLVSIDDATLPLSTVPPRARLPSAT